MTLHLFNPNSKEYKKIEKIYKQNTCMVCNLPMKTHSLYFFSFDKDKAKDGEMHEKYHIGCNHCFSLYDSDFILVEIDMRYYIGYTIRNIA